MLPLYAFWHFDDFSWGQTRKVEGETKKGEAHGDSDGKSADEIEFRKWIDWEKERRMADSITLGSIQLSLEDSPEAEVMESRPTIPSMPAISTDMSDILTEMSIGSAVNTNSGMRHRHSPERKNTPATPKHNSMSQAFASKASEKERPIVPKHTSKSPVVPKNNSEYTGTIKSARPGSEDVANMPELGEWTVKTRKIKSRSASPVLHQDETAWSNTPATDKMERYPTQKTMKPRAASPVLHQDDIAWSFTPAVSPFVRQEGNKPEYTGTIKAARPGSEDVAKMPELNGWTVKTRNIKSRAASPVLHQDDTAWSNTPAIDKNMKSRAASPVFHQDDQAWSNTPAVSPYEHQEEMAKKPVKPEEECTIKRRKGSPKLKKPETPVGVGDKAWRELEWTLMARNNESVEVEVDDAWAEIEGMLETAEEVDINLEDW